MDYKLKEVTEHFVDTLKGFDKDFIRENWFDLHHHIFNTDYYIIGRWQAAKWLGKETFNVIEYIKNYEKDNFGEVNTDFSEPEQVVNMYVYIIGETIVDVFRTQNQVEVKEDGGWHIFMNEDFDPEFANYAAVYEQAKSELTYSLESVTL